jgi:hypothetical protein
MDEGKGGYDISNLGKPEAGYSLASAGIGLEF